MKPSVAPNTVYELTVLEDNWSKCCTIIVERTNRTSHGRKKLQIPTKAFSQMRFVRWQSLILLSISVMCIIEVILPNSSIAAKSTPSSNDVCNWLPPEIEELAIAIRPPRKIYPEFVKSDSLNLCLLPLLPGALLRDLDSVTVHEHSLRTDSTDISGTWYVDLDFDRLPRFSGQHKFELHTSHSKIYGNFFTEERTLVPMYGKYTTTGQIMFTLPVDRGKLWIEFTADAKPQRLVGSYTRFERDELSGHIAETTGTWSAQKQSDEGGWSKEISFCVKGRGKFICGTTSNDDIPEECQIVILNRPISFDFARLQNQHSHENGEITAWHENEQTGPRYYLAQPTKSVLLVATSKRYLKTTIQRMRSKASNSSVRNMLDLPHLSENCAYRVIRQHRPSSDVRSSHYRLREFFGLSMVESNDIGLSFCQSTYTPAAVTLYYYSKGGRGAMELVSYLTEKNRSRDFVKTETVSNSCSRITITPSNDEERRATLHFFQVTLESL